MNISFYVLDDNSRVRLVQTNPNQQKHFNDYINATSIEVILILIESF